MPIRAGSMGATAKQASESETIGRPIRRRIGASARSPKQPSSTASQSPLRAASAPCSAARAAAIAACEPMNEGPAVAVAEPSVSLSPSRARIAADSRAVRSQSVFGL